MGIERRTAIFALFVCLAAMYASHAPFLPLPFFWDEVGQFVPAALDLYRFGALAPISVTPTAHPPGVMAYLAGVWSVFGYSIPTTRAAMLLLGGICAFLVLLLGTRLGMSIAPAAAATALLCVSPVFYAQAMLAQLDMPAMLLTLLATILFLREQFAASALSCIALVWVKETGIVAPALFGLWLLVERRVRPALYFTLPAVALAGWFLFLRRNTGNLFGSAEFAQFNLAYMLHPARVGVALAKRLYHMFWENLHWIGAIGVLNGWRRGLYQSREWRIAWMFVTLHVVLVSVLGGAMLERYLLPAMAVVYLGMVAGWWAAPEPWRSLGPAMLALAVAACNFWNPPYPFPWENNLAFTDFVRLHQTAARYVEQRYSGAEVTTAWPLSAALMRPELGYVRNIHQVREIQDFSSSSMDRLQNTDATVFIIYSLQWDPPSNLMRRERIRNAWRRVFPYEPQVTPAELDEKFGMKPVASWTLGGQWIEIHARKQARNQLTVSSR